jgi:hypothetical protein
MFTALRGRAARNGLLVDDTVNRDYLILNPQPATVDVVGDMELHERRRFEPETSWHESNWSFYAKSGQDHKLKAKLRIHHRVYSLHELIAVLERAGWRYVKSYGEFDLSPVQTQLQANNRLLSNSTVTDFTAQHQARTRPRFAESLLGSSSWFRSIEYCQ